MAQKKKKKDKKNPTPKTTTRVKLSPKGVDVQRKGGRGPIKVGDTIQVQYEKTTETLKGVRKSKKVIKGVKFLREAQKKTKDSTLKSGKK